MKIVNLDGYAVNPGDLSWDGIAALGDYTVYEYTPPEETVARAKDAEIILTNKTYLTREVLEQLPKVRYIGAQSTGFDAVDVAYAKERGIPVTNIPAYSTDAVAQTVFALLLEVCYHVGLHADSVRAGEWSESIHFSYWKTPLLELSGKTMGVFGMGRIGTRVAEIAQSFGMKVIAVSRTKKDIPGVRWVERETLFRESDVLSLHAPLNAGTMGMINKETLGWMKPTAILINTSRGRAVNEAELAEALNEGRIYGAGLDVLYEEPANPENPLLTARNCVITPHLAWASREARERLMSVLTENLKAFLEGHPQNVVNP